MAKLVVAKVACMVVVCMLVAAQNAEATITCGTVASGLAKCFSYVKTGGAVPPACCSGIRSIAAAAKTPADRQAACTCLKNIARGVKGINYRIAGGLPGKCGVSINYPISPSVDCSKVH